MDYVKGLLLFAAIVFVIYLIQRAIGKGIGHVSANINQKLLFKSEYEEDIKIVSTPLIFESRASEDEIRVSLLNHIKIEQDISYLKIGFYLTDSNNNEIIYCYGGKALGTIFSASLNFSTDDTRTTCVFEFTAFHEKDGLVQSRDQIVYLRKQIKAAFKNVDSSVRISAGKPLDFNTIKAK